MAKLYAPKFKYSVTHSFSRGEDVFLLSKTGQVSRLVVEKVLSDEKIVARRILMDGSPAPFREEFSEKRLSMLKRCEGANTRTGT